MPHASFALPERVRRALTVGAVILLAAGVTVAPASAAPLCDGLAADAADYQYELECASGATEGAQVITLTASFTVPDEADNYYDGSQPLTVEGSHGEIAISGPGPDGDTAAFLDVDGNADVTVTNLAITDFVGAGAINHMSSGDLTINGVTAVTNGADPNSGIPYPYGAVVSSIGDVTITDSYFEGNQSVLGGAVSTFPADPRLEISTGAPPMVTVTDSVFANNLSLAGGAIFSLGSTKVSDSLFEGNVAETGGAVASFGAIAEFSGSAFTDNAAVAVSGDEDSYIEGGALAVDGKVTVTDSVVSGNDSEGLGGAIAYSAGRDGFAASLSITDSEIADNVAEGIGGAVWFAGGVTVTGSTFADNVSGDGAGAIAVAAEGDDVSITNATFAGNSSESDGPAVAVDDAATVTVTHATFAGNVSAQGATDLGVSDSATTSLIASAWTSGTALPSCQISGNLSSASNFDVDGSCTDGWSGDGDLGEGLDPQWGALDDNGGATLTLLPAATSPLVNAVTAGASQETVDQRGVARPQGRAHDIGAVELEATAGATVAFEVTTGAGVISVTVTPAVAVTGVEWIATGDLDTAPPADTALPYGALGFTVEVPQPGDAVVVSLTAPRPFTTLLKSGGGAWSEIDGATFSNNGTTVTYTLTDGGELDEDGEANGFIVDPVALAIQATFAG